MMKTKAAKITNYTAKYMIGANPTYTSIGFRGLPEFYIVP